MNIRRRGAALLLAIVIMLLAFTGCAGQGSLAQTTASVSSIADTGITEKTSPSCTLIVDCSTLKDNMDLLDADKVDLVPEDGILLRVEQAELAEGESVFDVLQRETRNAKLHMEFQNTPGVGSYIQGIGNLYEMDAGELSGWLYRVNGEFQGIAASEYILKDGDVVEYLYTCDMGADVGNSFNG